MIGGNDSLNNFITKAGGQLSFGNRFRRAKQPKGANFHTGYYYGPPEGGELPVTEGGRIPMIDINNPDIDFWRSTYLAERYSGQQITDLLEGNSPPENYINTPSENEDPVFFGFEVVINPFTSPLFNGEAKKFIQNFSSSTEIGSRLDMLATFQEEIGRYFKFEGLSTQEKSGFNFGGSNLFRNESLRPDFPRKRHYVKKIIGLHNLQEKNGTDKPKSFVEYKKDVLDISFYEDTTLSTGALISLYKLLYWSRLRGKGVLPENLLRFDCQIIVSEVRNISRVQKTLQKVERNDLSGVSETNNRKIERLQSKSSLRPGQQRRLDRLRQERGDFIQGPKMEDGGFSPTPEEEVLQMIKENVSRYVYNVYECQFFFENMTHPDQVDLSNILSPSEDTSVKISFKFSDMRFEKFVYNKTGFGEYRYLSNKQINPLSPNSGDPDTNVDISNDEIFVTRTPIDPVKIKRSNIKRSPLKEGSALNNLLQGVKRAALSEGQRQLNNQFRLLNNAIDKVRDSFGLGRMSAPTNVYNIPPNGSRFWFDVKNSLRNFVGDSLGNTIFGRGAQ
jgi:hypothetical protein